MNEIKQNLETELKILLLSKFKEKESIEWILNSLPLSSIINLKKKAEDTL